MAGVATSPPFPSLPAVGEASAPPSPRRPRPSMPRAARPFALPGAIPSPTTLTMDLSETGGQGSFALTEPDTTPVRLTAVGFDRQPHAAISGRDLTTLKRPLRRLVDHTVHARSTPRTQRRHMGRDPCGAVVARLDVRSITCSRLLSLPKRAKGCESGCSVHRWTRCLRFRHAVAL